MAYFSDELKQLDPDVIFVDQLSFCVPFFRHLYPKAKVLFYGHYPDRLLAQEEQGFVQFVKRLYRFPFDAVEAWSTCCADSVVVNSKFTRSVFRSTFTDLRARDLKVIYPCVDTEAATPGSSEPLWPDKKVLLSINRFERKKCLDLAVKAYAEVHVADRKNARLVIAGGYDPRSAENAGCHKELQELCDRWKLKHATFRPNDTQATDMTTEDVDVLFLLSVPNDLKQRLLASASLLVYTPTKEHFGIVPLEAMLAGVPVLATNTGGPLETIYDGRTGWLRPANRIDQWTQVMEKPLIPSSADALRKMGQAGRERVLNEFSQTKMTEALDREVRALAEGGMPESSRPPLVPDWVQAIRVLGLVSMVAGVAMAGLMMYIARMEPKADIAPKLDRSSQQGAMWGPGAE